MGEIRTDHFTFWISFKRSISFMESTERKLAAYELITDYGFFGIEPDPENTPADLLIWFEGVRPNIDGSIIDIENGKKGGRPRKKPPLKPPLKAIEEEEEKEKEFEKESEKEEETERPTSEPGSYTLNDIKDICSFEHIGLTEGQIELIFRNRSFSDYPAKLLRWYEKNPEELEKIKKISALKNKTPKKPRDTFQYEDQRTYDYDDLKKKLLNKGRGAT